MGRRRIINVIGIIAIALVFLLLLYASLVAAQGGAM